MAASIDKTEKDEKEKCLNFLLEWKVIKDSIATYKHLLTALLMINCEQAAEMVCTRLEKSAPDSTQPQPLREESPTSGGTSNGVPPKSKTGNVCCLYVQPTDNIGLHD